MKAKSTEEQIASWQSRIARAKNWQKFYAPNSACSDDANLQHWKEVEAKLHGYIAAATLTNKNRISKWLFSPY